MKLPPGDPSIENLFSSGIEIERSVAPSNLETEVTALFDELRNPVLRYLSSFGICVQDGEEVVQEVFLALFKHLRGGKPRSNIRGWIFRVAHNLGLKRQQANQRNSKTRALANESSTEWRLDMAPDPEQQVASAQRRERLLAVVHALPEQDRRCLYLRAEGLRYREIADVLEISLGSVALSLERSLARLIRADGH